MSSRGSHRISVARHVYLRTQQHRLRHVKSVVIRNLTLHETNPALLLDPIAMETHFTIHPAHYPDKVLYKSYSVPKSYNPSWEAVQFNYSELQKYSAIPSFVLKLWLRTNGSNEMMLVFEKTIELAGLVYLGSLVNKDSSSYPPNSVVVGMFEGYYSHPGVGGVPCPPKITHSLEKLLPPQSLLEVNKLEVRDSYVNATLLKLVRGQERLNQVASAATQARERVESLTREEEAWFARRRERELVKMRLAVLRSQLADTEREESEERNQLCKLRDELDTKEQVLHKGQTDLGNNKEKYRTDHEEYCRKRDMLVRAKRNQLLRQKNMIVEAAFTFFITDLKDKFTICNVILQNSDQLDQPSNVEQPGVALGYVAHLVHHLAQILLVPLQYEIRPNGSRSHICDYISNEAIIDDIREFPLYLKSVERALFHYAVHLLNKNIAQIRQHCGYGMSKSMLKRTLPNIKYILERIITELSTQSDKPRNSSLPTTPTHSPLPVGTPVTVPIGTGTARERPSTSSTPQISFTAESEEYSTSVSSAMSFQQSEEGSGSRPLSPVQIQDTEQSFYGRFEQTDATSGVSAATQQYPTMQSDLSGRHYPVNATKKPLGTLFSSIPEDVLSSSPKSTEQVSMNYVSPGKALQTQSYDAHAGLHRAQSTKSEDSEEMGSAGMDLTRRDDSKTPDNTPTLRTEAVLVAGIGSPGYEADSTPKLSSSLALADVANNQRTIQEQNTDIAVDLNDSQLELNNDPLACEQLNKISTSSQRILDSASLSHTLIEAGYSRTVLATPHRVSGGEDINNISTQPAASKTINYSNGERLSKQVKTVNNKTETDGLLEDFIDGF